MIIRIYEKYPYISLSRIQEFDKSLESCQAQKKTCGSTEDDYVFLYPAVFDPGAESVICACSRGVYGSVQNACIYDIQYRRYSCGKPSIGRSSDAENAISVRRALRRSTVSPPRQSVPRTAPAYAFCRVSGVDS